MGVQAEPIAAEAARFFVPPYVGHRGWIGVRLGIAPERDEVAEIVQDGYRLVAPKRLSALLDRLRVRSPASPPSRRR
ncbi:hypothetical protein [Nocardia gipuzkoensis]|uniref:hypothetical protein n=1 Tax=Nocardia gipuzkoensis TaxID=2749991 RepID=UPI0015EF1304